MPKAKAPRPHNRDGIWYLIRRVPKAFAELDRRGIIRVSTDIRVADDPRAVRARAAVLRENELLEAYWSGLRDGKSAEARLRYEAAQQRARSMRLTYHPASELADGVIDEIRRRFTLLYRQDALDDELAVAAALGGERRPGVRLSEVVDAFKEINLAALQRMSPGQQRKWRVPRETAMQNFIKVLGEDRELGKLTRDDCLAYRQWWVDKILLDDLDIGTANKQLGSVWAMLRAVDEHRQLGMKAGILDKLTIKGARDKQRPAYAIAFVRDVLLAPGALDGLNAEARDIILCVAEEGFRPSEICNLDATRIFLDAPIPFVRIAPEGRVLKTDESERDIPLIGYALEALRRHPRGFPRYFDKEASFSAVANKYLAEHKLRPGGTSVYSLRHTFKDRMRAIDVPDSLKDELMGHARDEPKYGAGYTLEHKLNWLKKLAFKQPEQSETPDPSSAT